MMAREEKLLKNFTHSSIEVMPKRTIANRERSISSGHLAEAPWWE